MAKTLLEQERPTTMIDALGNVSTLGFLATGYVFKVVRLPQVRLATKEK